MRDISISVFHGRKDQEVSVERSREMVQALRAAGSNVKYTEYRFSGYAIWDRAHGEDELADWLFAQQRKKR
jgi:predicted peptidase